MQSLQDLPAEVQEAYRKYKDAQMRVPEGQVDKTALALTEEAQEAFDNLSRVCTRHGLDAISICLGLFAIETGGGLKV